MTTIMGIRLEQRTQTAIDFQQVLTKFGCIVKTRLGLHDVSENVCAPNGIIILEVIDDIEAVTFESELKAIAGIEIKIMKFEQ